MEHVWNFLLSKKQTQKEHFDRAHNARELEELKPGQEVLFLSPVTDEYIPSTIIYKAPTLHSYIIEAQCKCYCRTRDHTRPIHLNIHQPAVKTPASPYHTLNPKIFSSLICPNIPFPPPKTPSLHLCSHIPRPTHPSIPIPQSSPYPPTCVKQLLHHLTSLNDPFPSSPITCGPLALRFPLRTQSASPNPCTTLEKIGTKSPHSTSTVMSPSIQWLNVQQWHLSP